MGWGLKEIGGLISAGATGGAWSTDGSSGYMQGGAGVSDAYNSGFKTSAFTDFIPGVGDANAQQRANKANVQQAELNRQFQERMSNTAYQRAMADMKKAGLNPILAYQQGGASSPSGSTAQIESASKTGLADFALKSITGVGGLANQMKATQQQQNMNESSIQLNATQSAKNVADAERIRSETRGMGKKEEEGKLWSKFYKGINNILDTSAKDARKSNQLDAPLIKKLGPASKKESSKIFNWITKPKE